MHSTVQALRAGSGAACSDAGRKDQHSLLHATYFKCFEDDFSPRKAIFKHCILKTLLGFAPLVAGEAQPVQDVSSARVSSPQPHFQISFMHFQNLFLHSHHISLIKMEKAFLIVTQERHWGLLAGDA